MVRISGVMGKAEKKGNSEGEEQGQKEPEPEQGQELLDDTGERLVKKILSDGDGNDNEAVWDEIFEVDEELDNAVLDQSTSKILREECKRRVDERKDLDPEMAEWEKFLIDIDLSQKDGTRVDHPEPKPVDDRERVRLAAKCPDGSLSFRHAWIKKQMTPKPTKKEKLLELSPDQKFHRAFDHVCNLAAIGLTDKEISKITKRNVRMIKRILATPFAQRRIEHIHQIAARRTITLREKIDIAAHKGVNFINSMLTPSFPAAPEVKLKASLGMLDRNGYSPVKKSEKVSVKASAQFTKEQIDEMQNRLASMNALPVDIEVEEQKQEQKQEQGQKAQDTDTHGEKDQKS